jgi:hypothetical protein
MKTQFILRRLVRCFTLSALAAGVAASVGCMTTYDSAGRPVQSVDPGLAVAGIAAAGVLGYALADDNDHYHHHHGYYGGGYYGGGYYGGPPHRRYYYH